MCTLLCQICGKNTAVVQVTKITEKKRREVHLCEECAKKRGLLSKPVPGSGKPGMRVVWVRKESDKE